MAPMLLRLLTIVLVGVGLLAACTQLEATPISTATPTPTLATTTATATPTVRATLTPTPTPAPTLKPPPTATYFLETKVAPSESGSVEVSPSPNQDGGYAPGTTLTLRAVASPGFSFVHWEGDVVKGITANSVVITINSNLGVAAVFGKAAVFSATLAPCVPTPRTLPSPISVTVPPGPSGPLSLEVVGQIGGPIKAVAVQSDLAFVGVGLRLSVLDVSDPTALREVGATESLGWFAEDAAIAGDLVYVAAGGTGLHIVDVSVPSRPVVIGAYDTPGYAEGVAVAGRYAYVADGPGGLRIIDIADPASPTEAAVAYGLSYVFDVALSGSYAYLAAAGAGLLVADVSDPARPVELGRLDTPGYAYGIAVSENTAYIADGWEGLVAVDVADPRQPKDVWAYETPGWAMDVAVDGNRLHVADAFGGLRVLDLSDRAKPTELGAYEAPDGHAQSLAVSGSVVYVADRNLGLHVVDVSSPAEPRPVGFYSPMGFADGVAVAGSYAYVAAGRYGFRVVDLADPRRPKEVGAFDTQNSATTVSVSVSGSFAYMSTFGWHVLDISDPAHPLGDSSYGGGPEVGMPRDQLVHGDTLYVANEWGFALLDVSQPGSLCLLSFLDFSGGRGPGTAGLPTATGVAVSGDVAYVAAEEGGLWTFDVSNPRNPTLLSVFDEPVTPELEEKGKVEEVVMADVAVAGNLVYIADHEFLRIVDVTDPRSPKGLGSYRLPTEVSGWGPSLAVAGSTVYVADGAAGLVAVDVSDPANPSLAGNLLLPGFASGVAVDDKYVYVAAEEGGLFIVQATAGGGSHEAASTVQPQVMAPLGQGLAPLAQVASFRRAEPAAVAGPVTPSNRGGGWGHAVTGSVRTSPALDPEVQEVPASSGITCTVTSAADSGPGTLRRCLEQAGSGDTITFDRAVFPPDSPTTIRLATGLFLSQGGLTIDGSNAGVILDGSGTPPGTDGLGIDSDHNLVKGLQVLHFSDSGVNIGGAHNIIGGDRAKGRGPMGEGNVISGNGLSGIFICCNAATVGNRVIGNYIGLDASGAALLSNGDNPNFGAVLVGETHGNIIGGPAPADRNVITGNGTAIHIKGGSGNTIVGNYIGTDATGRVRLGKEGGLARVLLDAGTSNNRIEANVIVGDVLINDPGSSYNEVIGNFIGIDATGTVALGGRVRVGVPFNRIGGTTAGERNVIAGGVNLGSTLFSSRDNLLLGNYIGTDVTGTRAIGAGRVLVRGRHNFVGGTTEEERNIVAGGVSLSAGAVYNFVAGNYIGTDVTGAVALPTHVGISVQDAEHNAVHANLISGGGAAGVQLSQGASFNWLRANRITRSNIGIEVTDGGGEGNLIVGNSLVDNGQNGYDGGQNNHWDDGQQGNYWSDYEGVDADGDGTGDAPYPISPNGEDQYPIMAPPQPP